MSTLPRASKGKQAAGEQASEIVDVTAAPSGRTEGCPRGTLAAGVVFRPLPGTFLKSGTR